MVTSGSSQVAAAGNSAEGASSLLPPVVAGPQLVPPGTGQTGPLSIPGSGPDAPRQLNVQDAPANAAAGQGKIRLVFGGESWTEIREAGGRVIFSRNNLGGTEQWAEGQAPFDLVVGNARDVKLFYRGAEVDLSPYIKVSVARLQLK